MQPASERKGQEAAKYRIFGPFKSATVTASIETGLEVQKPVPVAHHGNARIHEVLYVFGAANRLCFGKILESNFFKKKAKLNQHSSTKPM